MVTEDLKTVKLIDFGMSRKDKGAKKKEMSAAKTGSIMIATRWASPELFCHEKGTIYSFKTE